MTVAFAILGLALVLAAIGMRRSERLSIRRSDPAHERTAAWPGALAGLGAFLLVASVVAWAASRQ